jgi:hypothetical protein
MPQIDDEHIVLKPDAPLTPLYHSRGSWSGDRCVASGRLLASVPIPVHYTVPSGNTNAASVFLLPDRRTLVQAQPLARCAAGALATSLLTFPQVDLYGDGMAGSHGGSALSALGGALRMGELRPGSQGPRHALKIELEPTRALFRCQRFRDCYRWPATVADSKAVGLYGAAAGRAPAAMKMGALLAIPARMPLASLRLETEPGRQLAWTLQNYGAYVVDTTGGSAISLNAENGPDGSFRAQFEADYGTPFEIWTPGQTAWSRDIARLMQAMHVVENNGPRSIGGGGKPLQPLAPPLSPPGPLPPSQLPPAPSGKAVTP